MKTITMACAVLLLAAAAQLGAEPMYHENYRPQFHYSPPLQWMNDPNGMVYYQGEYHLFFQYHPYSSVWGPMHWGHAVSKDMVHWETLPVALYPDHLGAIFSGSIVVDKDNVTGFGSEDNPPLIAFYSYHDHIAEALGRDFEIESQALAYSTDRGRNWTKYDRNPVLKNPGIRHFRDPKVSWYAPGNKWIMVLAAQDHVAFYSSTNLLDWRHESDFGFDIGSRSGVWECPDLIELQVEGEQESKWVLLASIVPGGPNGGSATQYFVGDFDGSTFTLDDSLKQRLTRREAVFPDGEIFDDFEGDLSRWQATGDSAALAEVEKFYFPARYLGNRMLSTGAAGDAATGTARSSLFRITHPYINFFIGGGNNPGTAGLQLLIDDKVVRWQAAENHHMLNAVSWDVTEFIGNKARFQVVDAATDYFGKVYLDNIVFAEQPAIPFRQDALWLDYGTDNYAGVTWSNIPAEDGRTLFIGWSNNWDYAKDVPTDPWRSAMTVPRELRLARSSDGYVLKSLPVAELQTLRRDSKSVANVRVKKTIDLGAALAIKGGLWELNLDLDADAATAISLSFANEAGDTTVFTIDREAGQYQLDRRRSGKVDFHPSFAGVQSAPIRGDGARVSLQVLMDLSVVEIFVNGGETVLTAQLFPEQPLTRLSLAADQPITIKSGSGHDLKSIWPAP